MTDYTTLSKEQQDIVSALRQATALDRLNVSELNAVFTKLDELG